MSSQSSSSSTKPSSTNKPNSQDSWLAAWYGSRRWTLWLLPVMWLFIALSTVRRFFILRYQQKRLPTPVVVVGNISVGGTGKTPLIIAMVKWLQQQGYNPGVISRGYGGKAPEYPYLLTAQSTAAESGDEPLAIFQQTGATVVVGSDRIAGGKLLEDQSCDILLSDDGLQHYRLGRDIEIAVVDGIRSLGNGYRLPVGPLREPAGRLKTVDWVVVNSPTENFALPVASGDAFFYVPMQIKPGELIQLKTGKIISRTELPDNVNAVAGIGNPERFVNTLQELGFAPQLHAFPDHFAFAACDLNFNNSMPIIMTEKDAVKCRSFAQDDWFYLPVSAELPDSFWQAFAQKLERATAQQNSRFPLR